MVYMKKIIFLMALILVLIPFISAINIQVEKTSENEALIPETGKPVVFDLRITNLGSQDNLEFYNLLGFNMSPTTLSLGFRETKEIQLELLPLGKISERGFYTFSYFIRSGDNSETEQELTFKIVNLRDAFHIGSGDVFPESNEIEIFIENLENFDFGDVNVKFSSAFFDIERNFTISPREREAFTVQLNNEDFRDLIAGFYTLTAVIKTDSAEARAEGVIKFVEKDIFTTTERKFGFLINTEIIEKVNEGNTVVPSETVIKKNVLSRLFTSFDPEPDFVEREGTAVYYRWTNEIRPGETLAITVRTNWLFPLLIVLFVVVIVVLVRQYSFSNLVLRKKVSFVRAKGGEFALKVSVFVNAKKYIERVNVIDRLPPLVNIYERFGGDRPSRIDEKNRRIEWNFEKLEAGEIRVLSYVIYSKVGVLGKFALPTAAAIYEKNGEVHEEESNRAFFVAEQRSKDLPEE